ncbi:hypothetical protein ACFWP7_08110 [Streptomyces sp. NPDC058470]|uniref:hypothetical protein n=1 Tax=Streptomyces sp. NPDC058470 TaxID=3346515 RepID=UPI003649A999
MRGALDLERTAHGLPPHRPPARTRARSADGQSAMAEAQPTGVRLVFRTRATGAELGTFPTQNGLPGRAPRPDGCPTCSWTAAATHRRIGARFAELAFRTGGPSVAQPA